jgi:hypothetical protein
VTARLIAARDAINASRMTGRDRQSREQALREALEHYEEVLGAFDRRVAAPRRGGERRKD